MLDKNLIIDYALSVKNGDAAIIKKYKQRLDSARYNFALSALNNRPVFLFRERQTQAANSVTSSFASKSSDVFLHSGIADFNQNTDTTITISRTRQGAASTTSGAALARSVFGAKYGSNLGQNLPVRFPVPIFCKRGENLNVTAENNSGNVSSAIAFHGSRIEPNRTTTEQIAEIKNTIAATETPLTRILSMPLVFGSGDNGQATKPDSLDFPETNEVDENLLVLGIGADFQNAKIRLTDIGTSYAFSEESLPVWAMAAFYKSPVSPFFMLPKPHLLAKGTRLSAIIFNGYHDIFEQTGKIFNLTFLCSTL